MAERILSKIKKHTPMRKCIDRHIALKKGGDGVVRVYERYYHVTKGWRTNFLRVAKPVTAQEA